MTKFPEQVRTCKVNLTQEKVIKRGEELAHTVQLLAQVEAEKREVMSSMKAKADTHEKRITELSMAIQNGYEYEGVVCDSVPDYEGRKVFLHRRDTGEVIEERAMLASEAQETLPLEVESDDEGKVAPPTFSEPEDDDEPPDTDADFDVTEDRPTPAEPSLTKAERKSADLKVVKPQRVRRKKP